MNPRLNFERFHRLPFQQGEYRHFGKQMKYVPSARLRIYNMVYRLKTTTMTKQILLLILVFSSVSGVGCQDRPKPQEAIPQDDRGYTGQQHLGYVNELNKERWEVEKSKAHATKIVNEPVGCVDSKYILPHPYYEKKKIHKDKIVVDQDCDHVAGYVYYYNRKNLDYFCNICGMWVNVDHIESEMQGGVVGNGIAIVELIPVSDENGNCQIACQYDGPNSKNLFAPKQTP